MNHEKTLIDRLEAGTLTRRQWTGTTSDGRETACLLAALAPECGENENTSVCPADIMPQWLAHLTPWIDDAGSESEWPTVVRRFAATAKNWGNLTERHEYAVRALCVREAMRHTVDERVLAACSTVAELCERVRDGESGESLHGEFASASASASAIKAEARAAAAWASASAARAAAAWARAEASSDRLIDQILTVLEEAA